MLRQRALFFVVLLLTAVAADAQTARPPIQQQLAFAPYHASGIYDVGETVGWTITAGNRAPDLRLQVDHPAQ